MEAGLREGKVLYLYLYLYLLPFPPPPAVSSPHVGPCGHLAAAETLRSGCSFLVPLLGRY